MADFISVFVSSLTGVKGSLTSSEHSPNRLIAYLAPTSPGSVKIALCNGISLSCNPRALVTAPPHVAAGTGADNLGATLAVTEIHPTPPWALNP